MAILANRRVAAAITLAAFAATGCGPRTELLSRATPTVRSEGADRLLVEAHSLDDGSLSLRVFSESRRALPETAWKDTATNGGGGGPAVASVGVDTSGLSALHPLAVVLGAFYIVAGACFIVAEFIECAAHSISAALRGLAPSGKEEIFPPGSASAPQDEVDPMPVVTHKPVRTVILVPAPGAPSGALLLGPQPAEGYRLSPALVERLGGPGATVTAVDAEDDTLLSKFRIGAPR